MGPWVEGWLEGWEGQPGQPHLARPCDTGSTPPGQPPSNSQPWSNLPPTPGQPCRVNPGQSCLVNPGQPCNSTLVNPGQPNIPNPKQTPPPQPTLVSFNRIRHSCQPWPLGQHPVCLVKPSQTVAGMLSTENSMKNKRARGKDLAHRTHRLQLCTRALQYASVLGCHQ